VYPEPKVVDFLNSNFIPVKNHIKEQPGNFERFGAQWTPTAIVLDSGGTERHRFEGFLPVDDFLAQLELGLAKSDFANQRFDQAEKRYRHIVEAYPKAEAAPEALYWAGVSRYKATADPAPLHATFEAFQKAYTDTSWAKKASVWA